MQDVKSLKVVFNNCISAKTLVVEMFVNYSISMNNALYSGIIFNQIRYLYKAKEGILESTLPGLLFDGH